MMDGVQRDRFLGICELIIEQAAREPDNPEAQAAAQGAQEALDEYNYAKLHAGLG